MKTCNKVSFKQLFINKLASEWNFLIGIFLPLIHIQFFGSKLHSLNFTSFYKAICDVCILHLNYVSNLRISAMEQRGIYRRMP